MGTRGLINVLDNTGAVLVRIYSQFDAYPTGLGADIKAALNDGKAMLTNGINAQEAPAVFNGMECLAAWLVKSLKTRIGGVYLMNPAVEDHGQSFTYTLSAGKGGGVHLNVQGYVSYLGPLDEFDPVDVEKQHEANA